MAIEEKSLEQQVKELLVINDRELEKEMAHGAANYFYFANLNIEAEDLSEKALIALEIHEVKLSTILRANHESVTQTEIKRMFRDDKKWIELKNQQLKLIMNSRMLDRAAKAFDIKTRLLTSMNRRDLYKRGAGMSG